MMVISYRGLESFTRLFGKLLVSYCFGLHDEKEML